MQLPSASLSVVLGLKKPPVFDMDEFLKLSDKFHEAMEGAENRTPLTPEMKRQVRLASARTDKMLRELDTPDKAPKETSASASRE
jgi:hypothetical protein